MYAHLRSGFCKSSLPISRLARPSAPTITTASSSSNPYPYPPHSNPTAHQIFHLPLTASQKEVKSRYYELVRIYHPDSPIARGYPPEVSEARFHAIATSYDVLRGRRTTLDPNSPDATPHPRVDLHALWRAKQCRRHDPIEPVDDRWKDRIILGSLFLALVAFVYQIPASSRLKTVEDVLQTSKRSRAEGTALQRTSEPSRDLQLLTASNSDPPDDTAPPLR
ncbi:hypothetical protein BGY98DRAFT_327742 [Russula aff. rugulosa BPL654]|nr:hypothetical protein BGY98DRAFT_327742 [Russula aff. rugulosa BPL654]